MKSKFKYASFSLLFLAVLSAPMLRSDTFDLSSANPEGESQRITAHYVPAVHLDTGLPTPPPAASLTSARRLNKNTVELKWTWHKGDYQPASGMDGMQFLLYRANDDAPWSLIHTALGQDGESSYEYLDDVGAGERLQYRILVFDSALPKGIPYSDVSSIVEEHVEFGTLDGGSAGNLHRYLVELPWGPVAPSDLQPPTGSLTATRFTPDEWSVMEGDPPKPVSGEGFVYTKFDKFSITYNHADAALATRANFTYKLNVHNHVSPPITSGAGFVPVGKLLTVSGSLIAQHHTPYLTAEFPSQDAMPEALIRDLGEGSTEAYFDSEAKFVIPGAILSNISLAFGDDPASSPPGLFVRPGDSRLIRLRPVGSDKLAGISLEPGGAMTVMSLVINPEHGQHDCTVTHSLGDKQASPLKAKGNAGYLDSIEFYCRTPIALSVQVVLLKFKTITVGEPFFHFRNTPAVDGNVVRQKLEAFLLGSLFKEQTPLDVTLPPFTVEEMVLRQAPKLAENKGGLINEGGFAIFAIPADQSAVAVAAADAARIQPPNQHLRTPHMRCVDNRNMLNDHINPNADLTVIVLPEGIQLGSLSGDGNVTIPIAAYLGGKLIITSLTGATIARGVPHEILHACGLGHPWEAGNAGEAFVGKLPDSQSERIMGYSDAATVAGAPGRTIRPEWEIIRHPSQQQQP